MTAKKILPLFIIAFLCFSCSREDGGPVSSDCNGTIPTVTEKTLLVEFSNEMASTLESGDISGLPEAVLGAERLYPDAGEWEARHREAGLHRWYRIRYNSNALPATRAVKAILDLPSVLGAEDEKTIKPVSFFNDPYESKQWALFNDGTTGSSYSAGADINVEPVWAAYTAGKSNVIVAVLDSGVDMEHPDLAAVCIPPGPDGSKCFVQGYSGYRIFPDFHGTHVAGTIAAINNNGIGVCGIAGGNDGTGGVKILTCQFMHADPDDPNKTLQGDANAAMVWAADHGAVISQNSWGTDYKTEADAAADDVGSMGTAIDYFVKYAGCDQYGRQRHDSPMKGGVVIFAAGNETWQYAWPAMYENVIAVGAMTPSFGRALYSNYGDWVDIAAPGNNILSTSPNGEYAYAQGTSMACPHVSGVAALIVSQFGGPGFTNEMLKERLLGGASSTKISPGLKIGPLADALGSFTYGGVTPPDAIAAYSVSVNSNNAVFKWNVPNDADDGKAYASLLLFAKDASLLTSPDFKNLPDDVLYVTALTGETAVGEETTCTVPELEFETDYYVALAAYDIAGNYSGLSSVKKITIPANNPPVITAEKDDAIAIHAHETLNLRYTVSEPDGHDYTVSVDPGSDAVSYSISEGVVQIRIVAKNAASGLYTATITATDKYGAYSKKQIPYTVLENHAPEVISTPDDLVINATGQRLTLDMTSFIGDEDGEILKYTVTMSVKNIVHLNPDGNTLILTSLGFGTTAVTVTAEDSMGESCSVSFRVLVQDGKEAAAVYPNPVKDKLTIRVRDDVKVSIRISNKAGATVYSADAVAIDPFNPYTVSVKDLPGGIYCVKISGTGLNETFNVAKI